MSIPERIRIRYEPDFYTRFIGTYDRGRKQFMAFVVASFSKPKGKRKQRKQWYAVLHTFDKAGTHLNSDAWHAGDTEDGEEAAIERAQAKRTEMLSALGKY